MFMRSVHSPEADVSTPIVRNQARRRPRPRRPFWDSIYLWQAQQQIPVILLSLLGCILLLLVIIAWLVVLLVSSKDSSRTEVESPNTHEQQALRYVRHDNHWKEEEKEIGVEATDAAQRSDITSVPFRPKDASSTHEASLQIVWLMSFPNSGTSYTSRLVRDATQTFTASNYADETPEGRQGIFVPVYANETRGPFWIIPAASQDVYTKPSSLVLTKTHCGIRCSLCSPNEYAETTYSFRRRCLVTKWIEVDAQTGRARPEYSVYSSEHVTKAVHLMRNPFDNVVSRFHLEHNGPNHTAHAYAPNRHGFLRYCLSIDYKYTQQEIEYMHFQENKLLQDLWRVPCHADFVKYVEWHNLAFVTTADLHLTTYVLHYDWYRTRYAAVLQELLAFLELPQTAAPPLFQAGKVYDDYYSREERLIVKRAFAFMASRQTWEQVQVYFPAED
jgi:Sulfotransferase domain